MNLCEHSSQSCSILSLTLCDRYEMYAGDRPTSSVNADSQASTLQVSKDGVADSGPALEVIEMANGETIW